MVGLYASTYVGHTIRGTPIPKLNAYMSYFVKIIQVIHIFFKLFVHLYLISNNIYTEKLTYVPSSSNYLFYLFIYFVDEQVITTMET